jgi:hypothetical protein
MVLAHGGVTETVQRHLPVWMKIHDRTIICSPADDPVRLPQEWNFVNGHSSRYAAVTNERTLQAMLLACELRPNWLTFCEYDALLWRWPTALIESTVERLPPGTAFVAGSQFTNHDPKFKGKTYLHTPIIFNPAAMIRVTTAMVSLPRNAEHGFGDRYFGLAVELAGVRVLNGHEHGLSFSQNHIQREHWAEAERTIRAGACFSHGIKDAETLDRLMKAAGISH